MSDVMADWVNDLHGQFNAHCSRQEAENLKLAQESMVLFAWVMALHKIPPAKAVRLHADLRGEIDRIERLIDDMPDGLSDDEMEIRVMTALMRGFTDLAGGD